MKKVVKKVAPKPRELDAREALFVHEYLTDLNVERSALAAGYSATMAKTKAYQWVSSGKVKPHVYAAIRARQDQLIKKLEITQERVLKELSRLGFSDARKFFDKSGAFKGLDQLDDDTAASLSSVEVFEVFEGQGKARRKVGETKKVKLWDKVGSLTLAMRHLGMLKDITEIRMPVVGLRDFTGKRGAGGAAG